MLAEFWKAFHALCASGHVSDLVLAPGRRLRIQRLGHYEETPTIVPQEAFSTITAELGGDLARGDRDGSWSSGGRRFRANHFRTAGNECLVLRLLPHHIPRPAELRVPEALVQLVLGLHQGLVLVCGPTGCGKSTTVASLLNEIAAARPWHIVTLEDPVEYLLGHGEAHGYRITQRQVGTDCADFATGLRSALRQAPRVIYVGEIRDRETAENALQASQTGHLVFSTLHTNSAPRTVDRFTQLFPPDTVGYAVETLADVLQVVACQRLETTTDGAGRCALFEIMVRTPSIAHMIRLRKYADIAGEMEVGRGFGHQTFALARDIAAREGLVARRPPQATFS